MFSTVPGLTECAPADPSDDSPLFLSTLTATPREKRVALAVLLLSLLVFALLAPFAGVPMTAVWGFIPCYESWLVATDLITAALLFSQYLSFNSRALFVLGCAYLYVACMTVAHALTFPGLFTPTGLLGAGPQSTAWLYMFWHGVFPLFVVAYARLKRRDCVPSTLPRRPRLPLVAAGAAMVALSAGFTALATVGQDLLPVIMDGDRYRPSMQLVVASVWASSLLALGVLWFSRPHSVLDLWLMIMMCASLIDIALSAMLNGGRFDLGFYAGRVYGLLAASFVLLVLLAESGILYRKLVQLTETLKRLTTQDALTGIGNRRAFDGSLDLELRRAMRSGQPLSLLMIDVDHFKDFNDHFGHVEGDRCLQMVARTLNVAVVRAADMVARYGGEEFVALLPGTDAAAAALVAERLREAVEALCIVHRGTLETSRVTISIGVACLHPVWSAVRAGQAAGYPVGIELVGRADRALYAAKEAGRNRVVVAAEPEPG
ncbi:sensor domain-containing diguanylate cyclase [Zoogloea sp. LCSB751]|uniref:sensor domain-containing diguanylate cyclase n=1 Tax=Zoogloea sp. LCSB751 TaxID=1965277 RepID=UPI001C1F7DCD|nr:sensor domain-containing diguanylate cyclase [Zoogloea sp. LCSB751]